MSFLERLRERFWFLPAVLCVAAAALAQVLVALDRSIDDSLDIGWASAFVYQVGASGSRDILGAIASSSLAVAGTTFSITMAVLALTSSTYGPRLVRNFMADRGNQMVLGVYVATFLYSLLVLRAVRVLGDPGNQDAEVFVPHLAVNVAVLLAVANVAVLVYFIHHISDSIQVSTLAHRVRTDMLDTIERLYPEGLGHAQVRSGSTTADHDTAPTPEDPVTPDVELARAFDHGDRVPSAAPGYVESIRGDSLLALAEQHDVLLALVVQPGDYVLEGTTLVLVHPGDRSSQALREALLRAVRIADARSPHQDLAFAVQQLTEMAVRAVSPGTNDPYTAISALDELGTGLSRLASREVPSPDRLDRSGTRRVHAPTTTPVEIITEALDAMRWYASTDPGVMRATLVLVERIAHATRSQEVRARLLTHIKLLENAFRAAGHHDHDVATFTARAENARKTVVQT